MTCAVIRDFHAVYSIVLALKTKSVKILCLLLLLENGSDISSH